MTTVAAAALPHIAKSTATTRSPRMRGVSHLLGGVGSIRGVGLGLSLGGRRRLGLGRLLLLTLGARCALAARAAFLGGGAVAVRRGLLALLVRARGREEHRHVAAVQRRALFDRAELTDVLRQP